ncbi:hypothetical protein FNW52_15865 [Flavobacterium sp. ZT3R18]|uniref:hypothetical protein n=1 Tax=Flavobacterium sp. ZT3R18 TaxID=2594429 RepID=UPI001179F395|nr:hypothetical protein [Flavobacterium sp. ZT3R18]TRX33234.1 hypothetical protein FNW52_15865 [Flavobacterium sp. ZT3R18]
MAMNLYVTNKEKTMNKVIKHILFAFLLLISQLGFSQSGCWFSDLAKELNSGTDEFKTIIRNDPDGSFAYQQLHLAGKSSLRKNPLALQAYTKTIGNIKLKELGFTDELLAKVNGYSDASFAQLMQDLDKLGNHLATNNIKIDNFSSVIDILKGGNANYRQGVHWIVEDLGKELAFKGKNLQLELRVGNSRETFSFIDLACKNCSSKGTDIMIEYKSGPGSITKETIQKQFIERDLFNANSLDEIQWRMKNTNLTKDQLVNWLTEHKSSIESIGKEKISKLLNDKDLIEMTDSQVANKLISYLGIESNYIKIFK